jgi:hypothetical protein
VAAAAQGRVVAAAQGRDLGSGGGISPPDPLSPTRGQGSQRRRRLEDGSPGGGGGRWGEGTPELIARAGQRLKAGATSGGGIPMLEVCSPLLSLSLTSSSLSYRLRQRHVAVGAVASSPLRPTTSSVHRGHIRGGARRARHPLLPLTTNGGGRDAWRPSPLSLSPSTPTGGRRREPWTRWWPDGRHPRHGGGPPAGYSSGWLYFFSFFVLFIVHARVRHMAKLTFFVVRPIPGAWQSLLDAVHR